MGFPLYMRACVCLCVCVYDHGGGVGVQHDLDLDLVQLGILPGAFMVGLVFASLANGLLTKYTSPFRLIGRAPASFPNFPTVGKWHHRKLKPLPNVPTTPN